jgi:hypothetical protein
MTNRVIVVLIIVNWLVMMFGLMRDEVVPAVRYARRMARYAKYEQLERLVPESRVDQMGIYVGGRRVGRSTTWYEWSDVDLTVRSETRFDVSSVPLLRALAGFLGGAEMRMAFQFYLIEGRLNSFQARIYVEGAAAPIVRVQGEPFGRELVLRIWQFGELRKERIPFDQRQFLNSALAPSLSFKDLRVGKRWRIMSFNPLTQAVESLRAEVVGRETLTLGGASRPCFEVLIGREGGLQTRSWVTPDGTVLKQEVLGLTFLREQPSAEAMEELLP